MIGPAPEGHGKRHQRDDYYVVREGVLHFADSPDDPDGAPAKSEPSTLAQLRKFRFSRLGPKAERLTGRELRAALARAMTPDGPQPDSAAPATPAGFTYLGQFVDHDLTLDATAVRLEDEVTVRELLQGRSPALDLDSLYGLGPDNRFDRRLYADDGVRLRTGTTQQVNAPANDPVTGRDIDGYDLPRAGVGSSRSERRRALIPDPRNDENLAVAQIHCAFIRFHNRVATELANQGVSSAILFETARATVVKHYQWMLRTDFLPRIVDPAIVEDVFARGRRYFEIPPGGGNGSPYRAARSGDTPTMPIEFSVAAYRLGHSMVRGAYQWNRVFETGGPIRLPDGTSVIGTLPLLFNFTGTSGTLSPDGNPADPDSGSFDRLPTNWIVDMRRLFDFTEAGRADLAAPNGRLNLAKRIDTLLVDPLRDLPLGSFGGRGQPAPDAIELNLAFRNLTRANMVRLATGRQMADYLKVDPLTQAEIENGDGGARLDDALKQELAVDCPLWFYILREAEVRGGGRLTGVGGRIVAETFHRAMEGSRHSIVRDPAFRPHLGPDRDTFRMTDLLLHAFEGKAELLNPLGDAPAR